MAASVLSLVLVSSTACSSGTASSAGATAPTTVAGRRLPDVLLSDLDGRVVPMRSLVGSPLVLNYWYSTCPPCDRELPALSAAAASYANRVVFIGIDPRDDAETARSYAASRGVTYRQLLDRTNASVDALSLTGFPTTILVGADGVVRSVIRHAVTAEELTALIDEKLLA